MAGHHLILGELVDYITGEVLNDTHDERYKQKIARFLVDKKGYLKKDITPRFDLLAQANNKRAIVKVDFLITLKNRICVMVKYGPGSLVTRYRPSLAASRLVAPYQVPVIIVTNGENADILDGKSGNMIASGFESIPTRHGLSQKISEYEFDEISPHRAKQESRILYAFEVDGSCPRDDTVCKIPDTATAKG